jgi:protocatechuate 3,4-dioxygenase beta subunit
MLEGVVRGLDGAPVAGALIVTAPSEPRPGDVPLTGRSDAQGRFRLGLVRAVRHVVRIEAEGLAPERREDVPAGSFLEVGLRPGAALSGTVRVATTGDPITGARVAATVGRPLPWVPEAGAVVSQTDSDGRFRMTGLPPGGKDLRVVAPGYRLARQASAEAVGEVRVLLARGGASIEGAIVDPEGYAVEDALVRAEPDQGEAPAAVRSDAAGRFVLASLEPGRYTIVARAEGFAPTLAHDIELAEGRTARVPLRLWPGAAVTGRLVAGRGEPATGTASFAQLDGSPVPWSVLGLLTDAADAGGRFRIAAVPSGTHLLEVQGEGHAPLQRDVRVGGRDVEVDLGDIPLREGPGIRGWVRNPDGQPIAGARVRAFEARPLSTAQMGDVHTDADGGFELEGLEPGTYRLVVSAEGHARALQQATAGTEAIVVLSPAAAISGLVLDESGDPVPSCEVVAWPSAGSGASGDTASDGRGRFRIEGLAEDVYVVQATAPGFAPARVSDVRTAVGAEVDLGVMRLSAGARAVGTISDSRGDPVAGAVVTIDGPGDDSAFAVGEALRASSDGEGRYEIRGLPSGLAVARARHPGYAEAVVSGIELDAARGPAEVDFVLTEGGRIEGQVRRRDWTSVPGAYVQMALEGADPYTQGTTLHPGPDGFFTAEHVTPGRVLLTLMLRSGGGSTSAQSRQLEVREGETSEAEFVIQDILVAGRVTRSGSPVAGFDVGLFPAGRMIARMVSSRPDLVPPAGPPRFVAVTGVDGRYELLVDQPGRFNVRVASADSELVLPSREVAIPDAETFVLDLDFAGGLLTGTLLDRDTREPVPDALVGAKPARAERPGVHVKSGPDGTFRMELDEGEYTLSVLAQGYAEATRDVVVSSGGAQVLVELARGGTLSGRVVDGGGYGVPYVTVTATREERGEGHSADHATTLPDGSFRLDSLTAQPHNLLVASPLAGFALLGGVGPGDEDVTLRMRPGGRLDLTAVGPGGAPVEGVRIRVQRVNGLAVFYLAGDVRTSANGNASVLLPAGDVTLQLSGAGLEGVAVAAVPAGGAVAVRVPLGPPAGSPEP